jgi:hypothetical protein
VNREEAGVKLKAVADRVQTLESLVEMERLSRRHSGQYDAKQVRELKAYLEKAALEQEDAGDSLPCYASAAVTEDASTTEAVPSSAARPSSQRDEAPARPRPHRAVSEGFGPTL